MSFTTIRGAGGVDVQFTGTDNRDILFAINEGATSIDAAGGNDTIELVNTTGVVGAVTAKGGAGNDTIEALTTAGGGVHARLDSASITAGPGRDTITSLGSVSSVLKGNEGADNFSLSGNYTNSRIAGNQGQDSFTLAAAITLEDTKIQGGSDNDGVMDFRDNGGNAGITDAIDSTINGGKGVDFIQIGTVTSSTNFSVFGGQDDDRIESTNAGSDGITYAGDLGNDVLSITGNADATVNGGDGNDILIVTGNGANSIDMGAGNDTFTDGAGNSTIAGGAGNDTATDAAGNDTYDLGAGNDTATDAAGNDSYTTGAGNDTATDAAGNDTYVLGDGNDTITNAAGNDTITGGAGADTYQGASAGNDDFIFTSISDSGAGGTTTRNAANAVTGFTNTFDTFAAGSITAGDEIDISAVAVQLAGNTLTRGDEIIDAIGAVAVADTVNTFAALQTAVANQLTASTVNPGANIDTNQIGLDVITIPGAGVANGSYLIVNNSNRVLDSGDMMFELTGTAQEIADTAAAFQTAVEAAFV